MSLCNCKLKIHPNADVNEPLMKKRTLRSIPSIFLNVMFSFFPKCPMCWAVYMSMLGSFGLMKAPFIGWLLPIFLAFLAVHLCMLLRRVEEKGYGPFVSSLVGFSILLLVRINPLDQEWIGMAGMTLIVIGSFWNSFTKGNFQSL